MKLHVYQDEAGEFRWTAKAGNGETVADSSEGYYSRSNALRAARMWRDGLTDVVIESEP